MKLRDESSLAWTKPQVAGGILEPSRDALFAAELPENLRNWFSDPTLVAWIDEEFKRFERNHPQEASYSKDHPNDLPAFMAPVLAFAFASGMFASDEIAGACRSDPVLHRLCNGRPPFQQQLCSFRRRNRPLLVQVLTGVFKRAITRKLGSSAAMLPRHTARTLHDQAVERLDLARHMDSTEGQTW